jgi:hypothetical protein
MVSELGGAAGEVSAEVAAVLITRYHRDADWQPEPWSAGAGVVALAGLGVLTAVRRVGMHALLSKQVSRKPIRNRSRPGEYPGSVAQTVAVGHRCDGLLVDRPGLCLQDDDVIHASDSPRELVAWLGQHGQAADTMFRVPENQLAATGLAPL